MENTERTLSPVKRIHGGATLPHLKGTAESESVIFSPERVFIPMQQHIGAPCVPCVAVGDTVFVGTKIAESESFVSAPVHSSLSGTVKSISDRMIDGKNITFVEIESDGKMQKDPSLNPFEVKTAQDLALAAKNCGLVGLGGAGFPTHVKLTPPKDKKIDTLIVNAAECEPYITSDYRECIENYINVMECIYLIKDVLQLEQVVICVESNKPKAIDKLMRIAADRRDAENKVRLMKLPTNYPQGAEKVIIYSATGRKLPLGKLPSDIGCIVMNVTSLARLYDYIKTGMPLVSKRITFDGTAVLEPKNIIVPIGTRISDVIDFAGSVSRDADKILCGGPMMGMAQIDDTTVIEKRTNAVLVMKKEKEPAVTNCIKCARCAAACPMNLFPAKVDAANRTGNTQKFAELNVAYCMECGSCSYVCPAKRPLTQIMRVAKNEVRRQAK